MEMTKMKEARKRMDRKKSGPDPLLDLAGWVSVIFGVILVLLGLWTQFHGEGGPLTASYRDDTVYVEAMYGKEARIPKEAELRARLITPEEDPEMYSQNMTSAIAVMGGDDETVPTNAIYNVGFYVGDQEVEPEAPVNVTLQVLKDGFEAGEPVQVIHLGEDDVAEVLADTSVDDAGFISFTTDGFSSFAFMLKPEEEADNGNIIKTASRKSDEDEYSLYAIIGDLSGDGPTIDGSEMSGNETKGDMTGLVSNVTITDKKGETVKDGKLFVGESYNIHLEFQEKGSQGAQFTWTDDGKMAYQIPKNFKVTPRANVPLEVTVIDADGKEAKVEIGKFSIDENGLLTVQLTPDGQEKLNGAYTAALTFDMEATAQKTKGGSDEDVHFGDTGDDFKFQVTDQPQITVDKKSIYDKAKHDLKYTVSAKVDHGPVHDLVVSDTLTPPQSKGITLEMVNGGDGKPEVEVTVIRNGETIPLTEEDYDLVPAEPDPNNPHAPQTFQVKLKEGSKYNPLKTDDELQVTYKYHADFDTNAADIYWGQVVNEATATGSLPMESPTPDGKTEITVEEKRDSYAEVYWDTDGKGVVSKDEAYSEATGRLHYTLYALAKEGEYTPFFINDQATVEYNGYTWIVQGFDAAHCENLKVYAQDVTNWNDLVDEEGHLKPEAVASGRKELDGYEYHAYINAKGQPAGYSAEDMDNYIYWMYDGNDGVKAADLYIYFGKDMAHEYGHWKYDKDQLITVEYDLNVSNGLTLYRDGETITLSKEEVLLAGITNTVHLRYGPFYPGFSVFFSNGEKLNKSGKLDKVHNTIDYTVSLNLQDTTVWDYMKEATGDPENFYDGIPSAMFYDDYDNGWNYVNDSLQATLYLKDGTSIPFTYYLQVHEWQRYNPDIGPADNFNDGDIRAFLCAFHCEAKDNPVGYELYLPSVLVAAYDGLVDRLDFTYKLKASDQWIKDHAYSGYDTNVHNTAEIKDKNTTHWSAEANVPYFPNRLTKTAEQTGTTNKITFTLEINTVGADLDPEKDYLIVTDESSGIQIQLDSIKVTDGNGDELTGIGNTTVGAEMTSDQWGLLPAEDEHRYKLKIPDGKTLRITYDALITDMGDSVPVSNKASIDGVARTDSSYEESLKVDKVHASGTVKTNQLTIEKTDSENSSKKLAAKFKFYIVLREGSELKKTDEVTVGGRKYNCYSGEDWTFTTDDNGRYTIEGWRLDSTDPGNYYILEEITAPTGYKKLKEPILFYFALENKIDREKYPDAIYAIPGVVLTIADPPIKYNLPETGGPGTLFYMVTGLMLVLGSGILLTVRKRLRQAR